MNTFEDKITWNSILNNEFLEYNDIYFRYEYNQLYEKHYEVKLEGFFWEDKYVKVFWGHLVRDISRIERFQDFKYYDLTTAYGYGGPLIITKTKNREKTQKALMAFFTEYNNFALKNNYLCEFIRFHPLFRNWKFLKENITLEYVNDVVAVDLTQELEDLWKNISKGQKYNIKKSRKEGCETEIIEKPTTKDIVTFLNIYYKSMDRNKASKKYYFSKEFIVDNFNLLDSILIMIKYKNGIIGASMFILGRNLMHYYLSGATFDFKGLYPSALALWEAIKWGKEREFECMHLGGGRGKNDSLFKFKRSFSEKKFPFYIGRKIFNQKVYRKLRDLSLESEKSVDYFPVYRYDLQNEIL